MSARWQWWVRAAVLGVLAVVGIIWLGSLFKLPQEDSTADHRRARSAVSTPAPGRSAPAPLPPSATAATGGEAHSMAMSEMVDRGKANAPLSPSDIQALLAFVTAPKPGDLTAGEWEERVNVILNLLRQQSSVPGLTDYLLATAEKHPSRILRLYAMQHLALWYQREPSEGKRREIVALLEKLAEKSGEETAGSAVMFLNDLQREAAATGGEVVKDEVIGRAALWLAADRGAKQDVRISALHTCVERKMADVLPAARRIAADTSAVIPLRKAAIFSIGQLGGAEDQTLLEKLGSDTPDLRPATAPALAKLRAQPQGGAVSEPPSPMRSQ